MGRSGRAPGPPASEAGEGAKDEEHTMSQKLNTAIAVIGIDIGKNSFHVGGSKRGAIVLRQKWSRGQVETRLANLSPTRASCVEGNPKHRPHVRPDQFVMPAPEFCIRECPRQRITWPKRRYFSIVSAKARTKRTASALASDLSWSSVFGRVFMFFTVTSTTSFPPPTSCSDQVIFART